MTTKVATATDWERALLETSMAFAHARPQWGLNDCVTFVADYLDRLGSAVPLPKYASQKEAYRILADATFEDLVTERLGPPHDPEPGDVVLLNTKNGERTFLSVGVWNGHYMMVYDHKEGVGRVYSEIIKAWSCHKQ